ncbi:hypothetical protein [Streptomyces sp. MNP-20]|uniref:hypothetical protein n=1 Tax=Streptomyces sp. MNP-20 TaxID=2721165 RepID=UPI001554B32F|nr:hypothetical protein [Streptomyces sp. MNP-20]
MIRLPATHAAVTAPLVASDTAFPGIRIGRSLLDGREVHLSPVLAPTAVLPSTNSLALGGLGSGKSTTGKARIRREVIDHGHQAVVIDSFGEDSTGEWGPLVRDLGGRVIEAGSFTLNPCSRVLPAQVREQLIRSLIAAVEPEALTLQAGHALQHALAHPKATTLHGLIATLILPEDGRWAADKLAGWGEGAAIALSRYTEGSLVGLFDGYDTALPPTDLPILSFDFARLDRNSPAIPSLMAAVCVWVEHVWLPRSTAPHRHLVLEEAWQILLSPATAELIQRQLKNSRKAGLSIDVIMHTLSDLGDGRAQDLARLCEVAHVGRLGPEEAALVGHLLGLSTWAVQRIPALTPGQAVWKIGPDHVDIIETVLTDEEARLTDTSARRRAAQQALAGVPVEALPEEEPYHYDVEDTLDLELGQGSHTWDRDLAPSPMDHHAAAVQAAQAGRCAEAVDIVVLGERDAIHEHGTHSPQAAAWLTTRAKIADICGKPDQAARIRTTVALMGGDDWRATENDASSGPSGNGLPAEAAEQTPRRRRYWPAAVLVTLGLALIAVQLQAGEAKQERKETTKGASYKGMSAVELTTDGIATVNRAVWSADGRSVILSTRVAEGRSDVKLIRIDSHGQTAQKRRANPKPNDIAPPISLELEVPVKDRDEHVTLRLTVGGSDWKPGSSAAHRTVVFRPDQTAIDIGTGKRLKQWHSSLAR